MWPWPAAPGRSPASTPPASAASHITEPGTEDRQRAHRHRRARRRDRGAQPGHRGVRPPLRPDHCYLCSGGPGLEGRLRVERAGREGRLGAHGREPASRLRQLRRAGGGLRGVHREINARPHRITRRAPVEMLTEEQARLHRLPATPFTATFGVTRTVADNTPMVTFDHCQYSVPHRLVGETVWVRRHGEQIVVVDVGRVARSKSPATRRPPRAARGSRRALPAGPGRGAGPDPATAHQQRGGVPGAG